MSAPAVRARDVSVALAGRPVLRRVALRVDVGELVTVLGTNGSGKSTLIRALVGLLPLESGSVEIFGIPVGRLRRARRRIGYVPQRSTASSGVPATVREVVMTGRMAHRRLLGWPVKGDSAAVAAALAQVRLTDHAQAPVAHLSGGQHQRVLIARALAGGADLLVLDEPTVGVDADTQRLLAELLARLLGRGVTVILVTHELGPLTSLVDRTVVLHDGRVGYDGPVSGLERPESLAHDHAHGEAPRAGLYGGGIWR